MTDNKKVTPTTEKSTETHEEGCLKGAMEQRKDIRVMSCTCDSVSPESCLCRSGSPASLLPPSGPSPRCSLLSFYPLEGHVLWSRIPLSPPLCLL